MTVSGIRMKPAKVLAVAPDIRFAVLDNFGNAVELSIALEREAAVVAAYWRMVFREEK